MSLPTHMNAVKITAPGGPENLAYTRQPVPTPGPGEVLIKTAAIGVNRADILQRRGYYPPPPGTSELPGLEVSGTIVAHGPETIPAPAPADHPATLGRKTPPPSPPLPIGTETCALLLGGGYAEYVTAPAHNCLPLPNFPQPVTTATGETLTPLIAAAALPEACVTVHYNLAATAHLKPGETLLIHGGGSGIGTIASQYAAAHGLTVFATVGSRRKADAIRQYGVHQAINYRTENFAEILATHDGADIILDIIGAKYLSDNLAALAPHGQIVTIGLQGGTTGKINLGQLLAKQGTLTATTLRGSTAAARAELVAQTQKICWPLLDTGKIRPVIQQTLPLASAAAAHELLGSGTPIGKILLTP